MNLEHTIEHNRIAYRDESTLGDKRIKLVSTSTQAQDTSFKIEYQKVEL